MDMKLEYLVKKILGFNLETMSCYTDNKALSNEFDLMTYLRENLPNRDSCLIYVSF